MLDNFVDIIGFQLEKVHTGIIAWLLDDYRSPLPMLERIDLVKKLAPPLFADPTKLARAINAIPEFSFGRSLRIDLVVEIQFDDDSKACILLEFKTDSVVRIEQLIDSEKAFKAHSPGTPCTVIIAALGAGQCTLASQADNLSQNGFIAIDLEKTIQIFSHVSIAGHNKIFDDWFKALQSEANRHSQVASDLWQLPNPWDSSLTRLGYRLGFPIFYMFYSQIHDELKNGQYKNWSIYSGSNNPVMNWKGGWLKGKRIGLQNLELYWEFNWDSFCLKAEIDAGSPQAWNSVRPQVIQICSTCSVTVGRPTVNRKGSYVTAYKWQFDFCKQSPRMISDTVSTILTQLHNKLAALI